MRIPPITPTTGLKAFKSFSQRTPHAVTGCRHIGEHQVKKIIEENLASLQVNLPLGLSTVKYDTTYLLYNLSPFLSSTQFTSPETCQSSGAWVGVSSQDEKSAMKHFSRALMKNQGLQWLRWSCSLLCWQCKAWEKKGGGGLPGCEHRVCWLRLIRTVALHNKKH